MTNISGSADASGVGRASALLASGTIVSRALGFISALVLAQTLGTQGSGSNAFALANQLPNNVYAIVAGGVLSAVLVPQIVRAGFHSDGGEKFINRIVTLGIVIFVTVAALATVAAPLLVRLYATQSGGDGGGGFTESDIALATAFAYWCLPQVLFYALYSLLGEVLNARQLFGPFTWAPVVNNVVVIIGLLVFNFAFSSIDVTDATSWTPDMVAGIGATATLGVAAQSSVLFLFWKRAGLSYRPEFRWRGVGLRQVGKAAGWTFGMILVGQFGGIVQSLVATSAGSDEPSVAVLRFAWLIFMLPHSIVAVSITTAYFTRMSTHARDRDLPALRSDVSASLRSIALIMVFATVGLIVIAYPFSALFTKEPSTPAGVEATVAMGNVLTAFLFGLIPFSFMFVLVRAFYALEDTRTPFFLQLPQTGVFVIGAVIASTLPPGDIAVGIAWSTTLSYAVQCVVAAVLLRKRLGGFGARRVIRQLLIFVAATIPAAAAGMAITSGLGAYTGGFAVSGAFAAVVAIAAAGTAMLLVYLVALIAVRNAELRMIILPIVGRLRGRR